MSITTLSIEYRHPSRILLYYPGGGALCSGPSLFSHWILPSPMPFCEGYLHKEVQILPKPRVPSSKSFGSTTNFAHKNPLPWGIVSYYLLMQHSAIKKAERLLAC